MVYAEKVYLKNTHWRLYTDVYNICILYITFIQFGNYNSKNNSCFYRSFHFSELGIYRNNSQLENIKFKNFETSFTENSSCKCSLIRNLVVNKQSYKS